MNTPSNGELVRWEVPFVELEAIGLSVVAKNDSNDFTVVVTPGYMDAPHYPKHLVHFEKVLTFQFSKGPNGPMSIRDYPFPANDNILNAYEWIGSPWIQAHQGSTLIAGMDEKGQIVQKKLYDGNQLHHYLMIDGTISIEVIVLGGVKIERIDAKKLIDLKLEF